MVVFTLYDPKSAHLLRLWDLSWSRRGWKTKLLTAREVKKFGSVKQAVKKLRGNLFVYPGVINFGFAPEKKAVPKAKRFPARGWESAPIVLFKREFDILNCGRFI